MSTGPTSSGGGGGGNGPNAANQAYGVSGAHGGLYYLLFKAAIVKNNENSVLKVKAYSGKYFISLSHYIHV